MSQFVDRVTVHFKAGNGGNGCASIRREKFKPLAGPNGGNGGNGGSIYLKVSNQVTSLLDYHFSAKKVATNGEMGYGDNKDGKRGENVILPVPIGTQVRTLSGELIADLAQENEEFLICQGGEGGLGNEKIASRARKAPGFALLGMPGEEVKVQLELKMLADVALVGFPSAGKSSLIASISAARPKIADYPFTTLTPNLGIVSSHGFRFTVADVPGLIPGAASGKGLGHEFLRHIERSSAIVHVIDSLAYEPGRDPISDLRAIEKELKIYDDLKQLETPLLTRPKLVCINKVDFADGRDLAELTKEQLVQEGYEVFLISAKEHLGLDEFVARLAQIVELQKNATDSKNNDDADLEKLDNNDERPLIELTPLKRNQKKSGEFIVKSHGSREKDSIWFEVIGEKPRKFVLQTDMGNDEAVGYLADRLAKIGVEDELIKQGAQEGDEVRISVKNPRADYIISKDEYFLFDFEPHQMAGAEQLYSYRRGEDARLDYENRVRRATRSEKRDQLAEKRKVWAAANAEFDRSHSGSAD